VRAALFLPAYGGLLSAAARRSGYDEAVAVRADNLALEQMR
jgi:hypothetical protein